MAKRHSDTDAQPALVPMSEEELRAAGRKLAQLIEDRKTMEADHAEVRSEQKAEREKLDNRIAGLAATIRSQGR